MSARRKEFAPRRGFARFVVKKADQASRIIEGVASTPTPDRMGDIVEPKGAKFVLPLPLLWQHDARKPVGQVLEAKATDEGIWFRAQIESHDEPGALKDRLDEAWHSVVKGLVRAVSVGFNATEPPEFMRNGGYRFTAWEWFELSLVTIPANAEATIDGIKSAVKAVRKSAAVRQRQEVLRTSADQSLPGVSGSSKPKHPRGQSTMAKSTAERIRELEDGIEAHQKRMQEIMEEADGEERDLDADETKEFDEESSKKDLLEARLVRLKSAYGVDRASDPATPKGVLRRVTPTDGGSSENASRNRGGLTVPAEAKQTEEKGLGFARLVMSFAMAKGNHAAAAEIAKQRYGADSVTTKSMQLIAKAAVAGGAVGDPSWAGPLAEPQNLVTEFVDYLRPQTIIGKFGANGIPSLRRVPFNIKVPAQTSGGAAAWVGEGRPKPVTSFSFEQYTLRFNKVASIAVISQELVRHSSPSAELMVRNALGEAVIARLDSDIVNPSITETTDVRPPSLNNGAQTYVSLGIDADAVRADIKRLVSFFITNNIPTTSLVLVMRQAQALSLSLMRTNLGVKEFPDMTMNGGMLEGIPVIASQYVPQGVVTAVCADEVYLADDGGVSIEMSTEASLQMDTAPTNAITDGASPPAPVATAMVSMFQTNSLAILAERIITWKRRRTAAVAYQTATGWGNLVTSPPQAAI